MAIKTYEIKPEEAERIPMFYHPELSESDLPNGLKLIEHDFSNFPPVSNYKINGIGKCSLTLRPDAPLIHYVQLEVEDDKFQNAKETLEGIFGFELK